MTASYSGEASDRVETGRARKFRRLHEYSGKELLAYFLLALILVTIYLNVGYVVANDIDMLCQGRTASSTHVEYFWLHNDVVTVFCPGINRPLNGVEFSVYEVSWPLLYLFGFGHWFCALVFQGGFAKLLGFVAMD